jgi:hypothetical protein
VRWALPGEQQRNKRVNVWIEYDGRRMVLEDWATLLGLKNSTLTDRMKKYPLAIALTPGRLPLGAAVAKEFGRNGNGRAVLTEDQVRQIRKSYKAGGVTMKELGAQYGIRCGHVCYIVNRRIWKYVED